MKAIQILEPSVMKVIDLAAPQAGDDEVLLLYNNIIAIFDKQNYEITNDNNTLNIKLVPMVHLDNSEITMMIPLKNIQSKELIQQLFDQNIAIGTRVNDLENEVKSLRSDFKNMSHIIENLKQSVKKFEENK